MSMKLDGFQPVFQPMMTKSGPAVQAGKAFEIPQKQEAPAKTDLFANRSEQLSMLEEMLKNSKDQSDQSAESFDDLGKCMTIAARIMNGDTVPQKDHKFLAEKYPELYEQAILMRRINHDPKKYKSLVEDEEEETSTVTDEVAGSVPREELLGAVPAEESAVLSE
ncbi:MAG: hypothetical protein K2N29_00205 [Ruminiclostridium sp.]|nr:hypothetical protein [Ruminiclostridium sp.]